MRQSGPTLVLVTLIVGSVVLLGVVSPVAAADEYQITIDGSIDTPTRQVTFESNTYQVSAVAKADEGESIEVDVTDPAPDDDYNVFLYNSDRQIVDAEGQFSGNETGIQFDTSGLESGSYTFVVEADGIEEAVHPLVIKGYEVSVTAPSSADPGDDVEVNVDVSVINPDEVNETNDRVEVVIAGETQDISQDASGSDGQYSVTMDTDSLDAGTYDVYATVRNDSITVSGRAAIFGISDAKSLDLTSDSEDDQNNDGGGGGGGLSGGAGGSTTTASSDETPTPIALTETSTPTETGSESAESNTENKATETEAPDQVASTDSAREAQSSQPTTTTSSPDATTPVNQSEVTTETRLPGFDLTLFSALILCVAALSKLRIKKK